MVQPFPCYPTTKKQPKFPPQRPQMTCPTLDLLTQKNPAKRIFRPFCSATYQTLDS